MDTLIYMTRPHLDDLPTWPLPAPFSLRRYRSGDEAAWTNIHVVADHFNKIDEGTYNRQFGSDREAVAERQYFLCDAAEQAMGTATAWEAVYNGEIQGQVHWVAIMPEFQGRGLARPLLATVLARLRELGHRRAFLITSEHRIPAVNLYLKFGFVPDLREESDRQAWRSIREHISHPALEAMRSDL